ncbi:hypothetical protein AB0N14_33875 [Streptomyces sp. NPDC051104]|uniref:hypothetical protein n=1 Tax=Streptomyces sp. NPDC051104 TaxID=3155044 RepID=UPI00344101F7
MAKAVGPALENVREFAGDGLFTAYNDEPNRARAHDILMPAFALGWMRTTWTRSWTSARPAHAVTAWP